MVTKEKDMNYSLITGEVGGTSYAYYSFYSGVVVRAIQIVPEADWDVILEIPGQKSQYWWNLNWTAVLGLVDIANELPATQEAAA